MLKILLTLISPVFALMSSHFPGSRLISYLPQSRKTVPVAQTPAARRAVTRPYAAPSVPELGIVGVKGQVALQHSSRRHGLRDHDLNGVLAELWRLVLVHHRHCHCSSARRQVGSLAAQRFDVLHRQVQHVFVLRFEIQRLQDGRQARNPSVTLQAAGNETCAGKFLK